MWGIGSLGLAIFPGVRDVGNYMLKRGQGYYVQYQVSPAIDAMKKTVTGAADFVKHSYDGDGWEAIYDAIDVIGYGYGLPGNAIKKGLKKVEEY